MTEAPATPRTRARTRWASALSLLPFLGGCAVVGYPAPPPSGGFVATPVTAPVATAGSYEVFGVRYALLSSADDYFEVGVASWYGDEFAGRPTASGEIFDPEQLTAAHRSLPLSTWVEVKNLDNGRSLVLRVNDRGPFVDTEDRIIDVSEAAARTLGFMRTGTARVEVRSVPAPAGGAVVRN